MPRLIAIGDVHGCDRALSSLLEFIQPCSDDTLIQLGDLVDRGTGSSAVIECLLELRSICRFVQILGDHEEMMLEAFDDPSRLSRWRRNGGTETLLSYGWNEGMPLDDLPKLAEHVSFLESGVDYFETEGHVFVHAGFVPSEPWNSQPKLALRWRVTTPEVTQPHCSGKTVICGHTAQKSGEILELEGVKCIDTNCVRGGWLTGLDVVAGTIWQVNRHGVLRGQES